MLTSKSTRKAMPAKAKPPVAPKSARKAATATPAAAKPAGKTPKSAPTPIKKPPTTPSSTPKRKLGRNHFQYKEPKVSPSVTRSGRKVRRPQEWWTNAQEHLGSTHKESDIKYRWGTGDAVLVKDGKRYRLSDVLLADQAAEPLSSSTHKSDTSDAQPAAGNSSNSSNE
ncbi:hypothetical protein IWW54_002644 [Coemansia sp. RSA 2705]|nr:hypothetical protein IWW54_002644 [Coemansia sp. RSA 2705]